MKPTLAVRVTSWAVFLAGVGGAAWWGKDLGKPQVVDDPFSGKRCKLVDSNGNAALVSLSVSVGNVATPIPYHECVAFAGWDDGTIVWSGDPDCAGPPMFRARVSPSSVSDLVHALSGDFAPFDPRHIPLIVCGSHLSLSIDGDLEFVTFGSDDEMSYERKEYVGDVGLVTSDERLALIRGLDERERDRIPYIEIWGVARSRIESLLPTRGERIDARSLAWERLPPRSADLAK